MKPLVIRVGGEAGKGIATAADILGRIFLRLGYEVFSTKDYASQIKGGHNYHTLRISDTNVKADVKGVDLLLALDKQTLLQHLPAMNENGIVIYDEKSVVEKHALEKSLSSIQFLPLPIAKIEVDVHAKNLHNAILVGAALKVLGLEVELCLDEIRQQFKEKEKVKESLLKGAGQGYALVKKNYSLFLPGNPLQGIHKKESTTVLWSGNEAVVQGALDAGVQFHVQYPMTPVSAILHSLAHEAAARKDLIVLQAEDEIAVINMALGASYAGKRAMTATSGGGFALMVEGLSLASMAEIPLVIIEGQRPGPATGLPTKTEQGDLQFVLNSGTGDFPIAVIAPSNIEDCYTETKRAFYLAEKYQLPVIILIDKHLAENFKTFDLQKEKNNFVCDFSRRFNMVAAEGNVQDKFLNRKFLNKDGLYMRYAPDNLQRTIPGTLNGIYTCAGDEHNEVGYIIEDSATRKKMMVRRMGKLNKIMGELPAPQLLGSEEAKLTLVGWGSMRGVLEEVAVRLADGGIKANLLILKYMSPFLGENVKELLSLAKRILLVENNYSGQLGELIAQKTGCLIREKILRYDGSAFTVDELYDEIKEKLNMD
ncbi:MAG: 2-oxoacid:acceptor oxidoreductase subunit alpha [Nanoarchaeota archaeon]